jgi:hypothetical protein
MEHICVSVTYNYWYKFIISKCFIYQLTDKRQYQDTQYDCENYYNNIKINHYKNFSIVTNIQTKHCISDASSGEIAHVKKVPMEKFV